MIDALVFVLAQVATPTPSPSPSPPPEITRVRVATGSLESLHQLPLPASLLTAAQLRANPASSADEALRALPGFDRNRSNSGFTNYGQLRVSFAGAGNDRGLVLVDGVPAQDAFGGQIDWAAYPAQDLTRAELLRGPGSALYGSGAIGGVLSLDTFAPTDQAHSSAAATFTTGSHDDERAYLQATGSLSRKFAVSLATSTQRLSYFDLPPPYQTPIDTAARSRASMISLRARYRPGNATTIGYGYRGAWDVQQEGRPNYDFWRNLVQNSASIAHSWGRASALVRFYERTAFVTNRADKSSSPGALLYTQYVPTHESGVIANWIVDSANDTFEVRGDARFVGGTSEQYNAENALTATGSGVQHLSDLALQNTWRWRRGEIVTGISASSIDLVSGTLHTAGTTTAIWPHGDRAVSPRLGIRYDLSQTLAIRASAGTGFRAPYLNELVRGYVIGPVAFRPNPNLVPERSSSMTAGFDWAKPAQELSADFTQTFVSDAISFSTISPTVQMRSNVARTQTDGVTLSYERRTGPCSSFSLWGTQQYARVTAGTPETLGKQLPYVPKASASGSYDTRIGSVRAGASLSYLGATYADDLNRQALGTAVTAGFHLDVPLRTGLALVFNGDNVTNARYLSSIDRYGPPSVFSIGLTFAGRQPATRCR